MAGAVRLPSGDVCFLFTDVEASTALLRAVGEAQWAQLQEQMHRIVRAAVEANAGAVVNTEGDGSFSAFARSADGVRAAAEAQRRLLAADWDGVPVRVRMGLHVGAGVTPRDDDYVALAVHRAARVTTAANGGQVLATEIVAAADESAFDDLGLFSVRDFDGPVRLFALRQPDAPHAPPRVPPAFDTQVPRYLTGLVGRDAEIAEIVDVLDTAALVTLLGPAGVGKTRLSVAVLSQISAGLAVGPWFVDVTEARAASNVGEVIASAIGCPPDVDIGVHLDTVLAGERGVLVLDHCEQLLDAARSAVEVLSDWCPTLQVIATSTDPLGLHGELIVRISGMELPTSPDPADVMRSASGRLFVERATAVRPGPELTPDAARHAFDVCHTVAGVPLALELAAGLLEDHGVEDVAALLGEGAIAAVVDACVAHLPPGERRALELLSVLESPIPTSLAAAAVRAVLAADDVEPVLAHLVRRAVLRRDPDGRYAMLATIRARVRPHLAQHDADAALTGLLAACLDATAGDAGPLARYEPVAATSAMLLDCGALPAAERQRLAAQLAPWWTGRLGTSRAREHLTAALQFGDIGPAAAALHLAIADTYPPGHETLDTEWHLQRAAVLLGEHDAVDPHLIARLQDATSRATRPDRTR